MKAIADALRRRPWAAVVALLALAGVLGVGALYLATGGGDSKAAAARVCHPDLRRGVLPKWARGGFSDPVPRMPHVLGRSREIVAIVFGDPLFSPPSEKRNNKILWVSRRPVAAPSDLRIRAQRMERGRNVDRPVLRVVDGGPGPSIIDLPGAGCWRLTLSWSGRRDTVDLRYVRRARAT
jgi:hypothetical protein